MIFQLLRGRMSSIYFGEDKEVGICRMSFSIPLKNLEESFLSKIKQDINPFVDPKDCFSPLFPEEFRENFPLIISNSLSLLLLKKYARNPFIRNSEGSLPYSLLIIDEL